MEKLNIKEAVERWTKDRLNFRSSFYTGRDPNSGDLNSTMLEQIYQGLKKEVGQSAATSFAKFVARLKDLSASAFIQAFERFWYGGFHGEFIPQKERSGDQITGNDDERISEGIALIANVFGGSRLNTEDIERTSYALKNQFVFAHKDELGDELKQELENARRATSWSCYGRIPMRYSHE